MRLILAKTGASAACAIALAITCTGYTFATTHPSAPAGTGQVSVSAEGTAATTERSLPAQSLPSPACSTATAPSAGLKGVRTATVSVHGSPFGVAAVPGGPWAFVAVPAGVAVLRAGRSLAPAVVRTIRVAGGPAGLALSPNGRYLLAAVGRGAAVISVARAERGTAGAVLGTLSAPSRAPGADSAIEVAISPDGQFAFVTLEYADTAVVFNLGQALRKGFRAADYVGSVPLGQAAVGMAVSPGGQWLYATSELALPTHSTAVERQRPSSPGRPGRLNETSELAPRSTAPVQYGTLTVINVRRAETHPSSSVVATVEAGCQPVRVITSARGREVWVTARASDDLLCFSAARLISDPAHALMAVVRVGEAPVGLAAVRGGSLIVVADSNRFGARGANADLDVVNVAAALCGRRAVVGHIPSGLFPREMALLGNNTLLVANYESGQVEAVDVASIPGR
jgi:DNA-binding beta-propeller fold protein YncE